MTKTEAIQIGDLIICEEPTVVTTVLGSCVSVALYSESKQVGGLIHFALPEAPKNPEPESSFRYGDLAVTYLIEQFCALTGEHPTALKAKVAGGAAEEKTIKSKDLLVGEKNIKIARKILNEHGVPILGEAVGGKVGRKVRFETHTGRLQVAPLVEVSQEKPKIKVLIVDDSKTLRDIVARMLASDTGIEVVGQASDAYEAQSLLKKVKPDVITLDVHMPRMTGVQWLEHLLPINPIPVIMLTSLEMRDGNEVFRALELGAVDYMQKPSLNQIEQLKEILCEKIKTAATAKVFVRRAKKVKRSYSLGINENVVLCIGASTGGTEAIRSVLYSLPENIPPTVIVQHIPPVFSKAFADRLGETCPFAVKEAVDGDELKASQVLIAPGGKQMRIEKKAKGLVVRITDDPPQNRHRPSVDYLFLSAAEILGKHAIGVILTGMGADGAKGLLQMRQAGARTFGQSEATCVVYGMPKAAKAMGAVAEELNLEQIPGALCEAFEKRKVA